MAKETKQILEALRKAEAWIVELPKYIPLEISLPGRGDIVKELRAAISKAE